MEHKSPWTIALLTVIACGLLAALIYMLYVEPKTIRTELAQEPARHTHPTNHSPAPTTANRNFNSVKGESIQINDWPSDNTITNPYTITGKVPGSWSNEGTFVIEGIYEGDIGIPGGTATLQGDWKTTGMVPFTATLDFGPHFKAGSKLTILLRKANPSGAPQNDDSLAIDVTIGK